MQDKKGKVKKEKSAPDPLEALAQSFHVVKEVGKAFRDFSAEVRERELQRIDERWLVAADHRWVVAIAATGHSVAVER